MSQRNFNELVGLPALDFRAMLVDKLLHLLLLELALQCIVAPVLEQSELLAAFDIFKHINVGVHLASDTAVPIAMVDVLVERDSRKIQ